MRKITIVTVPVYMVTAIVTAFVIVAAPLSTASAQETGTRAASRHWKSDLQHGHRPIIKPQLSDTRPKVPSQLQSDTASSMTTKSQRYLTESHDGEERAAQEINRQTHGCPGPLCEMRK